MARHKWAGEEWEILPERALFWPARRTLFIADPHFGKTATFRAAGIPIPSGTTKQTLERLTAALRTSSAERLVILGDFFHAKKGRSEETLQALADWRAAHDELDILLIPGNHDKHAGRPPEDWKMEVGTEPFAEPETEIDFAHDPACARDGRFTLCGHVHPAVELKDRDGSRLRLPCFHFGERVAILPAFSLFTGQFVVTPREGDALFVAHEGVVASVPTREG